MKLHNKPGKGKTLTYSLEVPRKSRQQYIWFLWSWTYKTPHFILDLHNSRTWNLFLSFSAGSIQHSYSLPLFVTSLHFDTYLFVWLQGLQTIFALLMLKHLSVSCTVKDKGTLSNHLFTESTLVVVVKSLIGISPSENRLTHHNHDWNQQPCSSMSITETLNRARWIT